ncbi:PAS domain S-box protein [Actinoplanes sp. KI2]|uniref:PAS domain S-box protein n=1 Tax=Actinoplanes sp. KI2 TaxID=2983315 RepID=UPI0021D58515|nr:PAS domain S-box protein [Actinoplanes sp. KI2]MCU7729346.1 PAS domain S-box protein [Actinoplanes sp. KI2]
MRRDVALAGCCAATFAIGLTCLLGYLFGVRRMVSLLLAPPFISPIAAGSLCLLACGTATAGFLPRRWLRRAGQAGLGIVLVVHLWVLGEYLTGRELGIDQLIFGGRLDDWAAVPYPGRPSPHSAAAFALLALALLTVDVRAHDHLLFRILAPLSVIMALATVLGALHGVPYLRGNTTVAGMSRPSMLGYALLATALVLVRCHRRPVNLFFSTGIGGRMTRQIVPSAVVVLLAVAVILVLTRRGADSLQGLEVMLAIGALLAVMYGALLSTALLLEDIGNRQDALNERLTRERDLNHAIFGALLDGVVACEPDGTIVAVNERFCELTGLSTETVLGQRPPYSWWTPERRFAPERLPQDRLAANIRVQEETQVLRPDGTRIAVERSVSAAFTIDQDVSLYVVTYRDLTERNEARAERRIMAERLDHFFDMSTDLLCIAGTDGYFKLLNPAWERVLGHPVHELMARPYLDFVHPDDRPSTAQEAKTVEIDERSSHSFENRYRHADGSYRWLSWNSTVAPGEHLIYAAARDVTDERAERAARTQLAAIIESTDDAVITKTLDGVITSWNAAAERIYGYSAEEAVGRPVSLIYAPDQLHDVEAGMVEIAQGRPVKDHQRVGRRKDGTPVHLSLTISPLRDADGTVVGASSIARDISDRIKEQQALAAARDQALAADRAKSEFVATVSHEIRTPLNGIIGLNTLMGKTDLRPNQRRYADGIGTSARALLSIINDILDFSKVEAGKTTIKPVDFDLAQVIADATRVAADIARGKDLEVSGYYAPDLRRGRHGDADRIRQVLINLLGNAVKFTDAGAVRLAVAETGEGDLCQFSVTDTGIGIEPDRLAALFEPFVQAEQGSNRTHGGTGLGLTISRRLVELMGGELTVISEPGRGSTFGFTLDLPPSRPGVGPRRSANVNVIGRRLLLADHVESSRALLADHARHWGMIVTEASGERSPLGVASLSELLEGVDVVVADPAAWQLAGQDFAALLRTFVRGGRACVIVLSNDPAQSNQLAGERGVADVLQRPVDPSTLFDCLVEVLEPRGDEEPADYGPPGDEVTRPGHGRILVVEDNPINQMVAEHLLVSLGYVVDIAEDGEEAVRMVGANSYSAVLMDCQMPKVDGYEATRQIRGDESPGQHLAIIAMTAGAMSNELQRCLDAGMDECLTKPIMPDKLAETLERWAVQPGVA